jgi:benzodiazapine receptor
VASDAEWYRSLARPSWQPPRSVFGIIWPYNFAMLVVATWMVASRVSNTSQVVWLISLALSVIAALTWAWLLSGQHVLLASGFALVLAFRVSPVLGIAFLPYQLWLAVATSLAFGYAAK